MRAALAALAVLVGACSSPPVTHEAGQPDVPGSADEALPAAPARPPIVVCLNVPAEVEDAVLAGVAGWREVTSPWRDWVVAAEPDVAPCDLWILEIGPYSRLCDDMAASGCTGELGGLLDEDGGPATVFLVAGAYEWNPSAVVMHEIGHTLGLTHEDGTLMQADWPADYRVATWECPDPRTAERAAEAVGAPELAGCELP